MNEDIQRCFEENHRLHKARQYPISVSTKAAYIPKIFKTPDRKRFGKQIQPSLLQTKPRHPKILCRTENNLEATSLHIADGNIHLTIKKLPWKIGRKISFNIIVCLITHQEAIPLYGHRQRKETIQQKISGASIVHLFF